MRFLRTLGFWLPVAVMLVLAWVATYALLEYRAHRFDRRFHSDLPWQSPVAARRAATFPPLSPRRAPQDSRDIAGAA